MRTHKDDRTPGCIHKKFDRLVHERDWDEDFFYFIAYISFLIEKGPFVHDFP